MYAICSALGIFMVPISKSGVLRSIHQCKLFCENNFCIGFMRICQKSGPDYKICEHLKMVENLSILFPETIMLSENVLESLSNGSDMGTKC